MLFSLLKQRLNWSLPMKNWQPPWRPISRSNGSGPFRYAFPPLEGETHRKNAVVIVSVKLSRSDLKSPSDGHRQPIPKMNPSDDETEGQENLRLAIVHAVIEMRVVHFYFRPELSINVILKGVVPGNRAANLGFV